MTHNKEDDTDARLARLRADLMATNTALLALMQTLPAPQRQAWLDQMAALSAQKADGVGSAPIPAMQAAMQQVQAAEQRLWQALQGAHRMAQP